MKDKVVWVLAAVVGCWTTVGAVEKPAEAEKKTPVMTRHVARGAFEGMWTKAFSGRKVFPSELVAKEYADFTATGVVWTIALPVADDGRLRFVKASFRDGAFASGTMHWMGLPAVRLSADDLAALRKTFSMLAVCDRRDAPAVLFHAQERRLTKRVPEQHALNLGIDPLRELYGEAFLEAVRRLRVDLGTVRCRVVWKGPDGMRIVLGEVGIARSVECLGEKAVCEAVGAANPDLVSERERVERYLKGILSYEMILSEPKKSESQKEVRR